MKLLGYPVLRVVHDIFIQQFGLVIADWNKFHFVTGFQLTQFPQFRVNHHCWTDETTQTWAIWTEDNWHITGEINRTNRIRVVVNIRWMQTCFTTIFTCPFRFWTNQADPGTARVKVDLKGVGKEGIDVILVKKSGAPCGPYITAISHS